MDGPYSNLGRSYQRNCRASHSNAERRPITSQSRGLVTLADDRHVRRIEDMRSMQDYYG